MHAQKAINRYSAVREAMHEVSFNQLGPKENRLEISVLGKTKGEGYVYRRVMFIHKIQNPIDRREAQKERQPPLLRVGSPLARKQNRHPSLHPSS